MAKKGKALGLLLLGGAAAVGIGYAIGHKRTAGPPPPPFPGIAPPQALPPPSPAPSASKLDGSLTPAEQQAVLTALATETNPTALSALAQQLAAGNAPIAAALVGAKANALAMMQPQTA
jgi:hypothetical protein